MRGYILKMSSGWRHEVCETSFSKIEIHLSAISDKWFLLILPSNLIQPLKISSQFGNIVKQNSQFGNNFMNKKIPALSGDFISWYLIKN